MRKQRKLSEETKKKITMALSGRKKSMQHREALSESLKNTGRVYRLKIMI